MRHTNYDLRQMKSLPLDAKIRMTTQRMRTFLESCEDCASTTLRDIDKLGIVVMQDMLKREGLLESVEYGRYPHKSVMLPSIVHEDDVDDLYEKWLGYGCNYITNEKFMISISTPMAFWTENDVLGYIVKYDLSHPGYEIICADIGGNEISAEVARDILKENPFATLLFSYKETNNGKEK